MRESGRDFIEVLAEAQSLGYAEVDPSFDIDGIDTAHKLAILTSLAFGTEAAFDQVYVEGISGISSLDIRFADEFGYRIKLLGIARHTEEGIEQRVHPCMVPVNSSIAAGGWRLQRSGGRRRFRRAFGVRGARRRCRSHGVGGSGRSHRYRQRPLYSDVRHSGGDAAALGGVSFGETAGSLLYPPYGPGPSRRVR